MTTIQIWSTANLKRRDAVDYWQEVIARSILDVDVAFTDQERTGATLSTACLDGIGLSIFEGAPQQVRRGSRNIARNRCADFHLMFVLDGMIEISQCGQSLKLGAGSYAMLASDTPYQFATSASKTLALRMPAEWLKGWLANPEAGTAIDLSRKNEWGQVLGHYLSALARDLAHLNIRDSDSHPRQIGSLLALVLGRETATMDRSAHHVLQRLRQIMAEHLWDTGFDPAAASRLCGISTRSCFAAFTKAGSTFGRDLKKMRLDRAARMLRDSGFSRLSVSEIAWRCGFVDASHFSRCFREEFATTPANFRHGMSCTGNPLITAAMLGGGSPESAHQ